MGAMSRTIVLLTASLVATAFLAGCVADPGTPIEGTGTTREIHMWVEQMAWEIAPGTTTTVWAFCAEGDGVEAVHGDAACSVPGPTIRVTAGDRIRLTFENTHTIAHTVHFHGRHPFSSDANGNGMLGEAMVTEADTTDVYEWVADPAGSFIYHCHFDTPIHMDMGMSGVFIVEDPALADDKPDREYVALLDEWQVDRDGFTGNLPVYDYFTINGKSFPLTQPWYADVGETVRIHMVNAGYEFHAFHIHGYVPTAYEGVAGPKYGVPTDVREIAPGQTIVFDFTASAPGVWVSHDHVVPRVTAASQGNSFGAYPRGMLTLTVVGADALAAVQEVAPTLVAAAMADRANPDAGEPAEGGGDDARVIDMKDFVFSEETVTIKAGTSVRWTNSDIASHTVTADDASFDSGDIAPGSAWTHSFDEPGTYRYHCTPHSAQNEAGEWGGMVATLIVEA